MGTSNRTYSPGLFYLGLIVAAAGLAFYLSSYPFMGSAADLPLAAFFGSQTLKSAFLGSFPSLTHALATSLLLVSIIGATKQSKIFYILLALATLLVIERIMGTFDIVDVYALLLGASIGSLGVLTQGSRRASKKSLRIAQALMITLGSAVFAVGSYTQGPGCARYEGSECIESKTFANPRYMSYSDLRSAVKLEGPHALTEIGRLYLYKSLIFMVEKNEGIHIIDNRFPANPEPIGFIRVPGNLDVSIRDNYLYADSYVDLVTLDLTDINDIREVNRDEDIFPYNAFQNIPYNIDFEYGLVDASNGVVVGYE